MPHAGKTLHCSRQGNTCQLARSHPDFRSASCGNAQGCAFAERDGVEIRAKQSGLPFADGGLHRTAGATDSWVSATTVRDAQGQLKYKLVSWWIGCVAAATAAWWGEKAGVIGPLGPEVQSHCHGQEVATRNHPTPPRTCRHMGQLDLRDTSWSAQPRQQQTWPHGCNYTLIRS